MWTLTHFCMLTCVPTRTPLELRYPSAANLGIAQKLARRAIWRHRRPLRTRPLLAPIMRQWIWRGDTREHWSLTCEQRNVVYTARDSPGQPRAIVVVHQKQLKFERGHRATRQCDITYIQRIYDTYKYHGTHIGHFGRFAIFYSPGRVSAPYIRSIPI